VRRLTGLAGLALVAPLAAQTVATSDRCTLQIDNVDRQGIAVERTGGTDYFAGGNVRLSCRGTKITMRSDSVASYAGNTVQFTGHVRYRDTTLTMDNDFGTYYRAAERWEARGNVKTLNLKTGSTLAGPSLDYYRAVKGVRDTTEMYAVSRPRIEYFGKDSAADSTAAPPDSARTREPYVIVADRVRIKGDDRIWAGGTVTVDRSDFAARGDSLRLDTGPANDGTLLGQRPTLRGLGADSFDLAGRRLDFRLKNRELEHVVAKGDAKAVNRDWTLVADTIAHDLAHRKLEHTEAWGDSLKPHATSAKYEIKADSMALDSPEQHLREARAFGKAWLGGEVDSVMKERDWLTGDTVIATFDLRDSAGTKKSVLTRLVARGSARSYHLDPDKKKPGGRPSINYARGDEIVITMKADGSETVDLVEVRGKADGVQLAPSTDKSGKQAKPGEKPPEKPPAKAPGTQ
jgi:hypothetical protein